MTGDTRYLLRKSLSVNGASSTGSTTTNSYTFTPSADATVSEAKAGTNFGSSGSLLVNGGGSSRMKSYLRFTVSGVSGTVQSAKLRVYAYNGTVDGPAVYGNSSSWSETGITWANAPQATTGKIADRDAIATNSWVEYDVRSLISSGGTGTYSLHFYTASSDGADFYSRESTRKPQLVLTTSTSGSTSNSATASTGTGAGYGESVPAPAEGAPGK